MNVGSIKIENRQSSRALRLKEAVIASFFEPAPAVRARMGEFKPRDWTRAKRWLDVSGLALYFLDRLTSLELVSAIPVSFWIELNKNLEDNRERTASLSSEALAITESLRALNVQCAVLKGITLPYESVPDSALRSQIDLDILVRSADAECTRECLAKFGYALGAVSGATWEFKAGPSGTSSLKTLYQVRPERSVEVHLIDSQEQADCLTRATCKEVQRGRIPCLSFADIFVQQGQHLFKHMCSEHTRASWVLEYWRHIGARRSDDAFWAEVQTIALESPGASMAIGAANLLAAIMFGPVAPPELSRWSTEQLPVAVCLWIQLYGRRLLLSDSPCSKLYLLLRKELNAQPLLENASHRRLLFPLHLPPRITRPMRDERLRTRLGRYRMEAHFICHRLRFHISEGLGLAFESMRWQRRLGGASQ